MDNEEKYNYNLLDKIDLKPYLKKWASIYDVIDSIEDDISCGVFEADIMAALDDPIMKREIFNYIGPDEFMDYLNKRYGTIFRERVDYYIIEVGNDINK